MVRNVVGWFELPVTNFDRAKEFYSSLFNVTMEDLPMPGCKMAAFPMNEGAEGATGAIVEQEGYVPAATGTIVYFSCEDVAEMLSRAEGLGAKIALPKMSIGEHGFVGNFIDLEGNKVALHSMK